MSGSPIHVDGKVDVNVVRQASAHGEKVRLLTLACPQRGVVWRQRRVARGRGEASAAPALLDGLDLSGSVVTLDAGLANVRLAQRILNQGGHYLMVIKGNQPSAKEALAAHFETPAGRGFDEQRGWHRETSKGHGRLEIREIWTSAGLNEWLAWPGVGQVLRRRNATRLLPSGRWREERYTYAVTSLGPEQLTPAQLLTVWRARWGSENRVFYRRDVSQGEDRCAVWAGNGPQVLAALRNMMLAAVAGMRLAGSLASIHRWAAANAAHALRLLAPLPLRS